MATNYLNKTGLTYFWDKIKTYVANAVGVNTRIFRATCPTAAGTAAKVATLDDATNFSLTTGVRVAVTFQYGNSATTPTLNVNTSGAKTIVTPTAAATLTSGNGTTYNTWGPYETVIFTYNGTYWVKGGTGYSTYNAYNLANSKPGSNAALGQGYGICSNSGTTTACTVPLSNYVLSVGGIVVVAFSSGVQTNSTLNINSKGAKAIKYHGSNIASGLIIDGDIVTFIYDGTNYHVLAIDRVANAAAVPADYVIDTAGNLNGGLNGYTTWASGKLEIWRRDTITGVNINSAYGSLYYGSISAISYQLTPSAPVFVQYPVVNITVQGPAGIGIAVPNYDNYSVSDTGQIYLYNPVAVTNKNITVNIYAVGRWKV